MQWKKLPGFLMIILQLYLRLNMKQNKPKRLEILSPKQILQRLPIALAQERRHTIL